MIDGKIELKREREKERERESRTKIGQENLRNSDKYFL